MLCAGWDVKLPGYFVTFDFAVKSGAVDSQNLGAAGNIPVVVREDLPDMRFFNFLQTVVFGTLKGLMA